MHKTHRAVQMTAQLADNIEEYLTHIFFTKFVSSQTYSGSGRQEEIRLTRQENLLSESDSLGAHLYCLCNSVADHLSTAHRLTDTGAARTSGVMQTVNCHQGSGSVCKGGHQHDRLLKAHL